MQVPSAARGAKVLVVDDEDPITEMLRLSLRFVGFEVETAASGAVARRVAAEFRPDLVLLDVMLPDTDGFALLRDLRRDRDLPVLFLTAKDAVEDRVRGLTLGADDYVTKPFSLEEVVARVGVILRRSRSADDSEPGDGRLTYADLIIDEEGHQAWRQQTPLQLSPTEFALLAYLVRNSGRVLSRPQILEHVWRYDFAGDDSVVDSYIRYLRRKVDAFEPPLIQTVRGVGYSLRLARAAP